MSRLNRGERKVSAPLQTESTPSGWTHEKAPGFAREAKAELYMKATTQFAGENTFYDSAETAGSRAVELIRTLAIEDWHWVAGFLPWLRRSANIRTMSLLLAAEAAQARTQVTLDQHFANPSPYYGTLTPRQLVNQVQQRGDEPTEILQYCLTRWGKIPMAVKRGAADAMLRLWRDRAVLRYDKTDRPLRFADAIELVHPDPHKVKAPEDLVLTHERYAGWDPAFAGVDYERSHARHLDLLFGHLLTERHHGQGYEPPAALARIHDRRVLSVLSPQERHSMAARALEDRESLASRRIQSAAAGQWEWTRSWLGEGISPAKGLSEAAGKAFIPVTDRQSWELVIPWMGYMAVLRNLRNFDQAGIRDSLVNKVCQRLSDPREVRNSRQLPFRFLSAYLNVPSVRWSHTLERAIHLSMPNVPELDGYTLILIDTSGSMENVLGTAEKKRQDYYRKYQKHDTTAYPSRVMCAAVLAIALALKNPGKTDVYGFANSNFIVENIQHGASLLRTAELFCKQVGRVGHGTLIEQNIRATFQPGRHTRIALFSDMQAMPGGNGYQPFFEGLIGDVTRAVPASVPVYAWNLAGYTNDCMATGTNRYALAGLTDHSFKLMTMLESGRDGKWPWETGISFGAADEEE